MPVPYNDIQTYNYVERISKGRTPNFLIAFSKNLSLLGTTLSVKIVF